MMFKPLTESRGEELLMSYRAGFHAKTYLPQEKEMDLTVKEVDCGEKWQGLLAKYDHNTHILRTVQCSLIEDLNECLQTWPEWGSMRNGECWERQTLGQNITEREFGLLPNNENFYHTPTTGLSGGSNSRKAFKKRTGQNYPQSLINPNLNEWLMGWLQGWTDLKPLETDKYRKWRQLHGNY
jgi:hypothetical protein